MKLISVVRLKDDKKKYKATFNIDDKIKIVKFGHPDYSDFPHHKDEKRKESYLKRHSNESWDDPLTPATLSRYILWNKPTLRDSIIEYKKIFNL